MEDDSLPDFDDAKTYWLTGSTLNAIVNEIRINRPDVVTDGGLEIASRDEDGTFFALPDPTGEGIAGAATYEVVTGADNGVAATRRVSVDPDEDGWQPV
jgi:hypothetical protein